MRLWEFSDKLIKELLFGDSFYFEVTWVTNRTSAYHINDKKSIKLFTVHLYKCCWSDITELESYIQKELELVKESRIDFSIKSTEQFTFYVKTKCNKNKVTVYVDAE